MPAVVIPPVRPSDVDAEVVVPEKNAGLLLETFTSAWKYDRVAVACPFVSVMGAYATMLVADGVGCRLSLALWRPRA